jgi:hypothetical protein
MKPKVMQAIEHQKTLFSNFKQIKEDTELLPMIFKAERAVREKAEEAKTQAEANSKIAVDKMD